MPPLSSMVLAWGTCDVLGFSLGGMVAQQMVLDGPTVFRRLILVGTAPRGGEDIMHLEKPRLAKHLQDPSSKGHCVSQKFFFKHGPQAARRLEPPSSSDWPSGK